MFIKHNGQGVTEGGSKLIIQSDQPCEIKKHRLNKNDNELV